MSNNEDVDKIIYNRNMEENDTNIEPKAEASR